MEDQAIISEPTTSKKRSISPQSSPSSTTPSSKRSKFYDQEIIKCPECDFQTDKRLLFKKHCILNHADKFDTDFLLNHYKCDFCDKVFKDPIQLSNHKNVHLGLKPFSCIECDHLFTTHGDLIRHTRYKHTLERPHKCELCDYSSVELSKLKRHMRVHTDERPYCCPFCEYASRDTFKLKRHLRVHTGEKPYECPICKTCFSQCNSLKVHMNSSHKDGSRVQKKNERSKKIGPDSKSPKSPKLSIPEVSYKSKPNDTTTGTPQKTPIKSSAYFQASDKSYYSNQTYLEEKNLMDGSFSTTYNQVDITGIEEIFTCSECNMKFTSSQLLDEHFVKHTGDRPLECNICNMKFGHKFSLQAHMLSHDEKYSIERKKNMKTINENTQSSLNLNSSAEKSPESLVNKKKELKKKKSVTPPLPPKKSNTKIKNFSIFQKKSAEIPKDKSSEANDCLPLDKKC